MSVALTPEFVAELVEWLSDGKSLTAFCKLDGKPSRMTVSNWLNRDSDFAKVYARAREVQADALVDQALDIVDGDEPMFADKFGVKRVDSGAVQLMRLRAETRTKSAAMLAPHKYGDRLALDLDDRRSMTPEARQARIQELIAMGVAAVKPLNGDAGGVGGG